jgi:hypothetical protein
MAKRKEENFQVSATGGAGTNGQPARYAAGIDNAGDFYDLQTSATMAGQNPAIKRAPSPSGNRAFRTTGDQSLVPLDAPSQRPDEDVRMGATMGTNAMYATDETATGEDADRMRQALPYLSIMAELPTTSNSFRNYVRYLKSVL